MSGALEDRESGLAVEELAKQLGGREVLAGISIAVAPGRLLAVLGRSGSGKTTLLRAIAGFERIDRGRIAIGGRAMAGRGLHVPIEARRIGYVAQEGALFPHLTVGQNILFGLDRRARREAARAVPLLEMVGLPASMSARYPSALSGGEQQRVALARALSTRPSLVLLDEPFSALDAGLRSETRRAVAAALAEAGATSVLVTHDQSEALSMGDTVAVLRDGMIAQHADPVTIYRRPADPGLARFVGEAVLLAATIRDGRATGTPFGDLALSVPLGDGPATVMIRPEQLVADPAGVIRARLAQAEFRGPDASLRLVAPDGSGFTARIAGHLVPPAGEVMRLSVDGSVMAWPGHARQSGS